MTLTSKTFERLGPGVKVLGHNSSDGELHIWHFGTEPEAVTFAKQLCGDTGCSVLLFNPLGIVKPMMWPTQYQKIEEDVSRKV